MVRPASSTPRSRAPSHRSAPEARSGGGRKIESSAFAAVLPALALLPGWLLAIAVFWLPVQAFASVPYWLFALCYLAAGVLLFLRPVQRLVLAPLLGARRPTVQELSVIDPLWVQVAQAAHADARSYVLAVLDADEINAFASGGHLVVVTTYAIEVMTRAS